LTALAALAIASSAQAGTLYQNDFSVNANGFTGGGALESSLIGSERYLGALTQGATAVLTLDTTGYSSMTLNFDLYTILSLDGTTAGTGPDAFKVGVTGGPVLLNDTFSNFSFQSQGFGPNASDPGRTGSDAALYGHLGYYWRPEVYFPDGGDATYHFSFTFAPTGNSTTISFFGDATQVFDDERFGIDNVKVSGVVPEPATWAMMILGFGAAGAALRRQAGLRGGGQEQSQGYCAASSGQSRAFSRSASAEQ
jgi:hypothetical protein